MKIYSAHGINDFVICCGYKGCLIKEYFANFYLHDCDFTVDLKTNDLTLHNNNSESWRATLVDTGENSMAGGRLKRVCDYLNDEAYCFTYGDGVADVDISATIAFHKQHDCLVALTAAQPPGQFGAFALSKEQDRIESFFEKPDGDGAWVNAGYFVLDPKVIDYIEGDQSIWEAEPLQSLLARDGQLAA